MVDQARAILWVQWRAPLDVFTKMGKGRTARFSIFTLVWYAGCAVAAVAVSLLISGTKEPDKVTLLLSNTLFFATGYWQFVPVMLATTGLSLELRKLIVYPIPHSQLYGLELLLRISTS